MTISKYWFSLWLAACLVPSHYLDQCCQNQPTNIVKCQLSNDHSSGLILGLHPASERQRYFVMMSHWLGASLSPVAVQHALHTAITVRDGVLDIEMEIPQSGPKPWISAWYRQFSNIRRTLVGN